MRSVANSVDRSARHQRRGMTLVEVLAVVVILGLIAGILLVSFSGSFGKARHELAKTGIGVIASKLEIYRMEHDGFPGNDVGLKALTDGMCTPASAFYLKSDQLLDPWGREFLYMTPGPGGLPWEILSYGADGTPGGEGENADISSSSLREKKG